MRKGFDRLLAGAVLALIVATPSLARPPLERAAPLPPSFDGQRALPQRRREGRCPG